MAYYSGAMKPTIRSRHLCHACICAALIFLTVPAAAAETFFPTSTAVLRWLDKVTGRVSTIRAQVGDQLKIGTLVIEVDTCMTRPPEETPESAAFLKIWDEAAKPEAELVFTGWMFASSPSLSALDHAVYDVWVLDCDANTSASSK